MQSTIKPALKIAKKILVVEDQGELCLAFDLIFSGQQNEFELEYVSSLLDADEYLTKTKPSVVILDNKLPDGFGVDFISYIRKKYPDMKIIMISGFGSVRDVALENGADSFIEKPFSLDKFNEVLNNVLS